MGELNVGVERFGGGPLATALPLWGSNIQDVGGLGDKFNIKVYYKNALDYHSFSLVFWTNLFFIM